MSFRAGPLASEAMRSALRLAQNRTGGTVTVQSKARAWPQSETAMVQQGPTVFLAGLSGNALLFSTQGS